MAVILGAENKVRSAKMTIDEELNTNDVATLYGVGAVSLVADTKSCKASKPAVI